MDGSFSERPVKTSVTRRSTIVFAPAAFLPLPACATTATVHKNAPDYTRRLYERYLENGGSDRVRGSADPQGNPKRKPSRRFWQIIVDNSP